MFPSDEKIMKFLVKKGASLDVYDYRSYTPLMELDSRDNNTIRYMLKYSDVNRIVVPLNMALWPTGTWCDK